MPEGQGGAPATSALREAPAAPGGAVAADEPGVLSTALATGTLAVRIAEAELPPQALIGFAARHNTRRGFLFVSKVLGKHWPATPAAMRDSHDRLAALLDAPREPHPALAHDERCDDGPVLVVGMAETATGLGQGVFEACMRRGWRGHCLVSTRYPLPPDWLTAADAEALSFEEGHSHAPQVRLYWPRNAGLERCTRLVLVDDELSTGQTFVNLWAVLASRLPRLVTVDVVCLTDFLGDAHRARLLAALPAGARVCSLLRGSYAFTPRDAVEKGAALPPPVAQAAPAGWAPSLSPALPRLGTRQVLTVPVGAAVRALEGIAVRQSAYESAELATSVEPAAMTGAACITASAVNPADPIAGLDGAAGSDADRTVLVLGMGELMHPAYALGAALEAAGHEVRVQSATRSPILPGHAIGSALRFDDPYGEGIAYYLYNVRRGQYARVLVLHETGAESVLALCEALDAVPLALDALLEEGDRQGGTEP